MKVEHEIIKEEKTDLLKKPVGFRSGTLTAWEGLDNKDLNTFNVYLPGALPQTAANFEVFSIVRKAIEIVRIDEVHSAPETVAGALTLNVERLTGTTAPGAGSTILSTAFDLKAAADTVQSYGGHNLTADRILKDGERLALVLTGAPTDLAGLCLTVHYKFAKRGGYN